MKTALTLARQDGVEVQARHFQTVLDIGTFTLSARSPFLSAKAGLISSIEPSVSVRSEADLVLATGTKFAGYMQRLKKMDRERLAEAIGTRLDLTANTLKSPEIAVASHAPKRRNEDDGVESSRNEDPDPDWDRM